MRQGVRIWELVVMAALTFGCCAFMAMALYEATWVPMSDNYRECGRIFLCHPPR